MAAQETARRVGKEGNGKEKNGTLDMSDEDIMRM